MFFFSLQRDPHALLSSFFLSKSWMRQTAWFAYTLFLDGSGMPSITALIHTENDALRLGRALETMYACDDILLVDHGSRDATVRVAREYGAKVVEVRAGATQRDYVQFAKAGWILCIDPRESLTER